MSPQFLISVRNHFEIFYEKEWGSGHYAELGSLGSFAVKEYKGLHEVDTPRCSIIGGKMTLSAALLVVVPDDVENEDETVEVSIPIAKDEEPVFKSMLAVLFRPNALAHSDKEVLRNAMKTYPKLKYCNYDSDEDYNSNDEMQCAPALRCPPPAAPQRQTRLTPDGSR